ncbi:glycosyltransferase [Candidatus Nomurabacteria bacterium]|nr:glycosyltransferase [Candidatus Nomurabacteria bacterium]
MNQSKPVISVIIAVYNGHLTLRKCIDTYASQTYIHKELIVIDGGSTDGSIEDLLSYGNTINYWISEPDDGIYCAWNKALQKANGEWICFLGADDFFWNEFVLEQTVHELLIVPPDIRVVYGQVAVVSEKNEILHVLGKPWDSVQHLLLDHMPIPHPALLHNCSIFKELGTFDESFKIAADYELLLRELKNNRAFFIPNLIIAGMKFGGMSNNLKKHPAILLEEARARRKNALPPYTLQWVLRFCRAILRNILSTLLGEQKLRRLAIIRGRITGRNSFWDKAL